MRQERQTLNRKTAWELLARCPRYALHTCIWELTGLALKGWSSSFSLIHLRYAVQEGF